MGIIEILEGNFRSSQILSNPNKVFVVADKEQNLQANTIFLKIKKSESDYYQDSDLEEFKNDLRNTFLQIRLSLLQNKTVVFTSVGYGNVEKIEIFSNLIKYNLDKYLLLNFYFNNKDGKKYHRIPSLTEIQSSTEVTSSDLFYNSLSSDQMFNCICNQKKLSICLQNKTEIGSLIKIVFDSQDSIICRVQDSFLCENISPMYWSIFELCDINKFDKNKYQTFIEFICTMDNSGVVNFSKSKRSPTFFDKKAEIDSQILSEPISNKQIYNLLLEINNKLDILSKNLDN